MNHRWTLSWMTNYGLTDNQLLEPVWLNERPWLYCLTNDPAPDRSPRLTHGAGSNCKGESGSHGRKRQPDLSMIFRSFPVSVNPPSPLILHLIVQLPVIRHTPYKREGVSPWLPHLTSLPPVRIGPPILSSNTVIHPSAAMNPIPQSPLLLRPPPPPQIWYDYLRIRLGIARNPGN